MKKSIFAIPLSSRHEKRCGMLEILFCLFQFSKNQQCPPSHFYSIFGPFDLHNLRFWCYFSKSFVVQWLRLLAMDWLMGLNPSLAIFFFIFLSQKSNEWAKPKVWKNWCIMGWYSKQSTLGRIRLVFLQWMTTFSASHGLFVLVSANWH